MKWTHILIAAAALLFPGLAMAIEEPVYEVTRSDGDIELRAYAPMIVAEVIVDGAMDRASSRGFRMIAGYIFGDNTSRNGPSEKIAMTAPVTMSDANPETSEKIAMTAPVTMQAENEQWRVHFVMPSSYTLDSLPAPNNDQVKLRSVPGSTYAAIRFSGLAGEKKVAEKIRELLGWLEANGITPIAEPELARYNPPWTLPFLRRNEILVRY